jgi:hypothetical protein
MLPGPEIPEWFSEPEVNVLESDAGFSVEVLGRVGMRYSEAGRTAFVDSEVLAIPDAMVAYRGSIKSWDPPHESEPLTEADRDRIIGNITRAFRFKGYRLDVM